MLCEKIFREEHLLKAHTVYLLVKVVCFVTWVNDVFNIKTGKSVYICCCVTQGAKASRIFCYSISIGF